MSTWQALGFSASPYNVQPLRVEASHVELLVGRKEEGVRFCTHVDSAEEGVFVVSGTPGVGKTSFFNIFQFLIESGLATCGPRLMAARQLCPLQADDDSRAVALRVLQAALRNVREYCVATGCSVPKQIAVLDGWANGRPSTSWDFSLSILGNGGGFGRSVSVPPVSEATFENICDAIAVIVSEVISSLKLDGLFIALDNVENLSDDRLAALLMAFRDTLFSLSRVWWVVIGQSGLYSLIQALDPRVSDRITGSGLELKPISLEELNSAVDQRVEKFHRLGSGKAPLSPEIHKLLYDASFGEIRFVFKYSNSICLEVVASTRLSLMAQGVSVNEEILHKALGELFIEECIPDGLALNALQKIVVDEINGLGLRPRDKVLLERIGECGSARSRQFKEFGFSSAQDFSSNYLTKLQAVGLLVRKQEGKAAIYGLRGLAILARRFGLLGTQ